MKRKDLYNYIKEEIVSALTESTIDVSNLAKGIYVLKVVDVNLKNHITKFYKK